MLCSSGLPTSLKATCWIKAENNHTAPSQPPPAHRPALLPLPALLSRKQSGFSSAAEPLRHGQISEFTRLTGTKPLGCQDDAAAVSESDAQFRLSTREGKKLKQVSRRGLFHALSSRIYPSIFHGLSTVLHLCSTHRLEGRSWLHCQAMAKEAETLLEVQSSHLPCLKTSGLNSCKLPII